MSDVQSFEFSSVLPAITECTPQELLPIMPPRVQRSWDGRIGPEGQMMFFGSVAEMIEHHSGLDPGNAPRRIDLQDVAHVLREIQDHGNVAALAGKRGAASAAEDGRAILARQRDCGDDVIDIARQNYADRNLAIVGAVGGVQGAAAGVETDLAA